MARCLITSPEVFLALILSINIGIAQLLEDVFSLETQSLKAQHFKVVVPNITFMYRVQQLHIVHYVHDTLHMWTVTWGEGEDRRRHRSRVTQSGPDTRAAHTS